MDFLNGSIHKMISIDNQIRNHTLGKVVEFKLIVIVIFVSGPTIQCCWSVGPHQKQVSISRSMKETGNKIDNV